MTAGLAPRVLRFSLLPLALLALWQGVTAAGWTDLREFPAPATVFARALGEWQSGVLPEALLASLARDLAGFALGAAAGIPLGLTLGLSPWFGRLVGPTFDSFKQIAIFAWIPLFGLWFGMGESAKVVFIATAAFVPITVNAWAGARALPQTLEEATAVLRFSPWQRLIWARLPAALPDIVAGLRVGLINAWLATVGAEYFMSVAPGLGSVLISGRDLYAMDLVLVGVLVLGLTGVALDTVASRLGAILIRWQ
ncbi:ABC transporter permease [Xanthobacter agilis]|uniref:Sulfonate transport system permease protein n=1 Tax=Xanthobacter agilis TaxID=47492 RepID=A0ABU0LBH7_XANAG|nr:ABC transporter permease subunit [Xanthobacter agilis]MDQ0504479.1 sulfonate transport system permease protein [Xanthobacter agilis]